MTNEPSRLLIIDDNLDIHEDFRKILAKSGRRESGLSDLATQILGGAVPKTSPPKLNLRLDFAAQGEQGCQMIVDADRRGEPYYMAFVDVRMPPGIDGIQTIKKIWSEFPGFQCVICTAFSDYDWEDIVQELGVSPNLLILKKPFEEIEVQQVALALLQKYRAELSSRLLLDELKEQVRHANQATQLKTQLLTNITHELRTPLTAILGFADVLQEDSAGNRPAAYSEALEVISRNGKHLLQLVNDLLDMSKIDAGKLRLEHVPCSPYEIVGDLTLLLKHQAGEKGLDVGSRIVGRIPKSIKTDPFRLKQILINLLGNALKFTQEGRVELSLELQDADTSDPKLRFDVTDTGIGISQENLADLFEPFVQADASMARLFGGTGLGLTISRRLAQQLGGDITVTSEPGLGSTFSLILSVGQLKDVPLLDAQELSETKRESTPAPSVLKQLDISGRRILVVDDRPDNQKLMSFVLTRAGAEVAFAKNGKVALDSVRQAAHENAPFDAVLMDMQMPVLDGYAAARRLRAEGFSVPIIAVTIHNLPGDREKCLEAGCDDYLTKPIDRRLMLHVVDQLVNRRCVWPRKKHELTLAT